jgi:hypothetical protein
MTKIIFESIFGVILLIGIIFAWLRKKPKEDNDKKIVDDLQEFCNIYLIDLVDLGFKIDVSYIPQYYHIQLLIFSKKGSFKWIDIKDNFLPFYEMLQYHYKLDYQIINKEPKHLELSHNMYFHNSEVNDDININRADYIKICINSKI